MKKILALALITLSAAATADTFECDAVSQLNRPAPQRESFSAACYL